MASDAAEDQRQSVFVVDDDESVGFGLVMLLKASGYLAEYFTSAENFLADWAPAKWGCGLIDVQMPGMDGLTLIERLCAKGAPPPELLVMTGRPTREVERRAGAAAVATVLNKPLDPTEVMTAVRHALCA